MELEANEQVLFRIPEVEQLVKNELHGQSRKALRQAKLAKVKVKAL